MIVAVIPAFNEENHIEEVVKDTKKYADSVIVVDDGSIDKTMQRAKEAGATVLENAVNMGKGFTLRVGVKKALGDGADIVVCLDADGQHDPHDIPRLVKSLEKEKLDIVFGSRTIDWTMPLVKRLGNLIIFNVSRILFGSRIYDTQSGFKVFRRGVYEKIAWNSNGYAVDSEIIKNVAKHQLEYKEMPIETLYSNAYKGTSVFDGIRIVLQMLKWKLLE